MDNPRPEKVAVVDEVRERLAAAGGVVLTEYRGLTVADLARLRRELTAAGGDYKVYKNTLVRLAVADGPQAALTELLTGPTGVAFVHGDLSAVAKALRTFAREHPRLVVKGGMVEGGLLGTADIDALATLPSRDVLLAQVAGALTAPLQQLAGLLEALPRNLAFGLSALVERRREVGGEPDAAGDGAARDGAAGESEAAAEAEATAEAVPAEAGEPPAGEAPTSEEPAGAEPAPGAANEAE